MAALMIQPLNPVLSGRDSFMLSITQGRNLVLLLLAVVAVACALGWTIASGKWLLVAAALAISCLLAWPIEAALGVYALLLPFEPMTSLGSGAGPSATVVRYVGLVALVVVPCVGWLRGRTLKPPRTALYWSLFLLWCTASSIWAIDQVAAFDRLPKALGLWLLYLAIVSVQVTKKELSRITFLCILGGFGASLLATYLFIKLGAVDGRASIVKGATQADPNFFAATLLLPLSLAFGEVLSNRTWWRRAFFLVCVVAISLAVFLSMSRGILASVAAILLVYILRLHLNRRLLIPVATLGVALLFLPTTFYERVHEAPTSRISGRLDIWEAGLHSLARYGLQGAGIDCFPNAYQEFAGTALFFAGDKRSSHNVYLTTAVEFGILGILAFVAALRTHLREFSRPANTSLASFRVIALEAACWGMIIAGISLDLLWTKAFWFVWAFSVIAIYASGSEQLVTTEWFELE